MQHCFITIEQKYYISFHVTSVVLKTSLLLKTGKEWLLRASFSNMLFENHTRAILMNITSKLQKEICHKVAL